MSVHTTVAPVSRRPSRWFVAATAVIAAGATAIALSLTIGGGAGTTRLAPAAPAAAGPAWLMSLTPARLASGALGLGYALPSTTKGPTTASVLGSMSPQTRRYTKAVTSLTFAQLAAGAAGSP
ncbi:MAG TPA: hypothetical protein VMT59_03420 [Gaiellaceae bacterium]|nr:hypothetical protein [Gaiellaceae bacterium]